MPKIVGFSETYYNQIYQRAAARGVNEARVKVRFSKETMMALKNIYIYYMYT